MAMNMQMDSLDDLDDDYEEVLVFISFADLEDSDLLEKPMRLEGLEGDHPTCRIGDFMFEGTHEYPLGSQLFFQEVDQEVQFVGQSLNMVNFEVTAMMQQQQAAGKAPTTPPQGQGRA